MIKQFVLAIQMSLVTFSAFGQTNPSPAVTNWGEAIGGAQLGIALSDTLVSAGTNITMPCWLKNSSTNSIGFEIRRSTQDFYVVLTNSSGSLYELTKDPYKTFSIGSMAGSVISGKTNKYILTLDFGPNIEPGIYQLFAKRRIEADNKWYDLLSNVLEVQVTSKTSSTNAPALPAETVPK